MKVKEESENVGLKFNIQKAKIMASGPIIMDVKVVGRLKMLLKCDSLLILHISKE